MNKVLLNDYQLINNPTVRDIRWSVDCIMETFQDPEEWRWQYEDTMSLCDTMLLKHHWKIVATVCLMELEIKDITKRKNDILASAKNCDTCRQLLKWIVGRTEFRSKNSRLIANFTVHPQFQGRGLWTLLLSNTIREKCREQLALFTEAYIATGSSHVFEKLWFHSWRKKKCQLSWTEESCMIRILS